MKLKNFRIHYKNGNTWDFEAYSMEIVDGKLYTCYKSPVGDQGYPSVI